MLCLCEYERIMSIAETNCQMNEEMEKMARNEGENNNNVANSNKNEMNKRVKKNVVRIFK